LCFTANASKKAACDDEIFVSHCRIKRLNIQTNKQRAMVFKHKQQGISLFKINPKIILSISKCGLYLHLFNYKGA
jgi:hypothetical protein